MLKTLLLDNEFMVPEIGSLPYVVELQIKRERTKTISSIETRYYAYVSFDKKKAIAEYKRTNSQDPTVLLAGLRDTSRYLRLQAE